jgi:WD40 repeat protein
MAEMEKDEAEFKAALAAARSDFENGRPGHAVERVVSLPWKWRYAKEPELFKLLQEVYATVESPLTEESCRRNPWQLKLLFEVYSVWPKVQLEEAILKHSFPEPPANEFAVSGAEQVQLAKYSSGLLSTTWGALSRGKYSLKFWDLETGEVIHARETGLQLLASTIGRDGSHVLSAEAWHDPETAELHWSTSFKETFRRIPTGRGGPYLTSPNAAVRYYKVKGEIVSIEPGREIEVERKDYEKNPVKGEVLRPREFKKQTPRLIEYIKETRSPEEAEEYFREDALARQREKEIVRVKMPQTLTLAHEAIEGYLPAGTTSFVAEDGWGDLGPKVSDLWSGSVTATVAVVGNEAWLENIIVPGHGLKGMYGIQPTTPITAVCLSSDGSLGLRNGNGAMFGMWNMWTGDCLREFHGHSDRVTCLGASVDVSFVVSGSEDKTLRLWKPITAECVRVFEGHEAAITAVCISLDATKILSADHDGIIKLWDRATGECLRTIRAHSQSISGLHITMDGKFAVSGSWDKTVKLWNLNDGSCMKTLEHSDWVTSVDMTPDGRYLVSSSYGETKVWELIWRLEPRDVVAWDEGARPYVEILLNANAAWDGKLSTPVDMSREEIENTLRRQGPTWTAWHSPSKKDDWHRVWHLNWDINETLGHAGYGWLSEAGSEGNKIMEACRRAREEPEV